MSTSPEPRTPPRFVPTLTEVVELPDWAPSPAQAPPSPLPPQPFMGPRPDAVLLTDVVPSTPAPHPAPARLTPEALDAWSDQITQQVLGQLDQRLAVVLQGLSAELAQYLAQSAAQQLQGELPDLVRQAVRATAPPGAAQAAADGEA